MRYLVGQVVDGVVTGIQPYGAFVFLDSNHKGLIHISEISSGFVKDVECFVKIGEKVRVKIIDVDEITNQCKLSLKAVSNTTRQRQKMNRFQKIPKMIIGFKTLEDHLDGWIKEGMKEDL